VSVLSIIGSGIGPNVVTVGAGAGVYYMPRGGTEQPARLHPALQTGGDFARTITTGCAITAALSVLVLPDISGKLLRVASLTVGIRMW
jgi:hypothetical protein